MSKEVFREDACSYIVRAFISKGFAEIAVDVVGCECHSQKKDREHLLYIIGAVKNIEKLFNKFLVPVRPGRKFKRIMRRQSADTLSYR